MLSASTHDRDGSVEKLYRRSGLPLRFLPYTVQSNAKNSAHPIFFPFALKTVKSRVLNMKDIVARALIYSTLYHYIGLILNQ